MHFNHQSVSSTLNVLSSRTLTGISDLLNESGPGILTKQASYSTLPRKLREYWDNGKYNGNYYNGESNGKENGK